MIGRSLEGLHGRRLAVWLSAAAILAVTAFIIEPALASGGPVFDPSHPPPRPLGSNTPGVPPTAFLDAIPDQFHTAAMQWEGALRVYAWRLFGMLALIEMAWTGIRLALRQADLVEWTSEYVQQIMFIGFFASLAHFSSIWSSAIVKSFQHAARDAAQTGGGPALVKPSNVFDAGMYVTLKIWDGVSVWKPGASVGLVFAGIIVIICFALIAAKMIVTLVESYLVISACVLLMGFGGSRWSKDYAVRSIIYAMSVGMKLFVMILVAGLGGQMITRWAGHFQNDEASLLVIIGAAIVLLAMVFELPNVVQSMMNGTSLTSGAGLVAAAASVAAAGAAVAGAGVAVGTAMKGAVAATPAPAPAASALGRIGQNMARGAVIGGRTGLDVGKAAANDIVGRLSGQRTPHGSMPWRMNEELKQISAKRQAGREEKPAEPPPPTNTISGGGV